MFGQFSSFGSGSLEAESKLIGCGVWQGDAVLALCPNRSVPRSCCWRLFLRSSGSASPARLFWEHLQQSRKPQRKTNGQGGSSGVVSECLLLWQQGKARLVVPNGIKTSAGVAAECTNRCVSFRSEWHSHWRCVLHWGCAWEALGPAKESLSHHLPGRRQRNLKRQQEGPGWVCALEGGRGGGEGNRGAPSNRGFKLTRQIPQKAEGVSVFVEEPARCPGLAEGWDKQRCCAALEESLWLF